LLKWKTNINVAAMENVAIETNVETLIIFLLIALFICCFHYNLIPLWQCSSKSGVATY